MYNGSGVPAFVYAGAKTELPRPIKDGRDSAYTPSQEPFENLDDELVYIEPRTWRYSAELEFASLSATTINTLLEIKNKAATMKFIPHIDVPQIAFDVIIDTAEPSDEVTKDGFKLVVRSKKLITKIPTRDNMITCFRVNSVIIHSGG